MLGDAQLEGLTLDPGEKHFTFMTNLTASALPVASPASAGLLSLAFLQVFEGGVEFHWNGNPEQKKPPAITFIGDKSADNFILKGKQRVQIDRIPVTQLPSVTVTINGVEMPALLDTGSPITVLNSQAAKLAGIETVLSLTKPSNNPFTSFGSRFQEAQAAARGDVLMIASGNGDRINLIKSKDAAAVSMSAVDFGSIPSLYVGNLPGLAALNGIGVSSPPAVVLGLDVLRQRPSMLLRSQDNEVWFD
jgi:Aspartyl protease